LPRRILLVAASLALGTAGLVNAVDDASLTIDSVAGDGWTAEHIEVEWHLADRALARVGKVRLAAAAQELRDVRIDCPRLELSVRAIACERARVVASWPGVGTQSFVASLVYGRADGSLRWRVAANKQRVSVDALVALAKQLRLPVPAIDASGLVTFSGAAVGAAGELHAASFDLEVGELTASNESGSIATDKLDIGLRGGVRRHGGAWSFELDVSSPQGQAYLQPIFLDFGVHPLSLRLSGALRGKGLLALESFAFTHSKFARGAGRALVDFGQEQPLRSLSLQLEHVTFPGAYASYLQPLLLETSFRQMQTAGKLAGEVTIEEGAPRSVDLTLEGLTLDDGTRKFAIEALTGALHWRAEAQAKDDDDARSTLAWRGGAIFGLAMGAADLQFSVSGRQFRLLQPTRIPLLDGALALESFRVRNAGLPSVAFMVDATLEPLDVKRVCQAFGWPEFGGRIGGTLSKLRMRDGVVTLGTTLQAQVFDGNVSLSDLQLQQPFGQWPRFFSNVAFDNLDLELMTGAFSFGRITGRLSGRIDGLRLFNWSPVAFDAALYTPPDDRSRHRISQRAVENVGSLGGGGAGVTAALSSGFLRFFDDFNYERLGLSCRLENDVCAMDGIAPAPNGGYYLVQGKGLPRIDVIGSSHRVDWPRLVERLIAATKGEGPVVQ
jgi:hypothetical protein